jgi:hypothetical protein
MAILYGNPHHGGADKLEDKMVTAVIEESGAEIARVEYASAEAAHAVYSSMRLADGTAMWEMTSPTRIVAQPGKHNGPMVVTFVGDI